MRILLLSILVLANCAAFGQLQFQYPRRGMGTGSPTLPTGSSESADIARMQYYFQGAGPVGIMALGMNNVASGTFGSCNITANIAERIGPPYYMVMRQLPSTVYGTTNAWFGYEFTTYESAVTNIAPPNLRGYSIYKPMKRIRFDNAACSDGDGGATAIQNLSSTLWTKCNVGSVEPNATRLGLIFGLGANNDTYVRVTITNTAGTSFTPNLLPTAQNCVDRLWLTNAALVANGGTLAPTDRVMSTEISGIGFTGLGSSARYTHMHVPIADNLAPGAYIVTVEYTPYDYFNQGTASDRFYLVYFTYGTAALAHTDSGAKLEKMDYFSAVNDGSADETSTLLMRPAGVGSYSQTGGDHGNEFNVTDPVFKVDGTQIYIHSRTTQRGITNNVCYLTTATPHGITTGDLITVQGLGSTAYNVEGAAATNLSSTRLSYALTAANENTTADTTGRIIRHNFTMGSTNVTIDRNSKWYHASYLGGTNALILMTQRYTVDRLGLQSDHSYTNSAAIDIQSSSFSGLMTTWKGSGWGPDYPDMAKWRPLGQVFAATNIFQSTNAADVTPFTGQVRGFVIWSSTTGKASVIYADEPSYSTGYWANGANYLLQDRAGNFIDKIYLQLITQNSTLLNISAGTIFTGYNRRLDAIFPNADTICQ